MGVEVKGVILVYIMQGWYIWLGDRLSQLIGVDGFGTSFAFAPLGYHADDSYHLPARP